MKAWRCGAGALALAAVAGCGGYAGDDAPEPFPGAASSAGSSDSPATADTAPVEPAGTDPTGAPSATATVAGPPGQSVSCSARRGRPDRLVVRVDPAVRASVASFRVQVLQGQNSRQVIFPVEEPSSAAKLGISYGADAFVIRLTGAGLPLSATWVPSAPATITVEGRGPTETVRFWRTRELRFRLAYPNGKNCEPEVFSAVIALRPQDRAAAF